MIRIADTAEDQLVRVENQGCVNIGECRLALEFALTAQLEQVAEGLLAWQLLNDVEVTQQHWKQMHAAHRCASRLLRSGSEPPGLPTYAADFVQDVALRRRRPIAATDLPAISLRVLNGQVKLWNSSAINRQLSRLGSALRLFFVGASEASITSATATLRLSHTPLSVDPRFVLGPVGPVSSVPYAPLFDFLEEWALYPLIEPTAVGFVHLIVLRRSVLGGVTPNGDGATVDSEDGAASTAELRMTHAFIHESVHVFSYENRRRKPYFSNGWLRASRSDLCRFALTPRTEDEFRRAFWWNFRNPIVFSERDAEPNFRTFLGVDLRLAVEQHDLEICLAELIEDGVLKRLDDGRLQTIVASGGVPWGV